MEKLKLRESVEKCGECERSMEAITKTDPPSKVVLTAHQGKH